MNVEQIILTVVFVVVLVSLTVLMFIVCLKTLKSEIKQRELKIKELYKRMETYDTLQDYLNRL